MRRARPDDRRGAAIAERRVQRRVRLYPPAWRERYGDEFAALLADDIAERPRSLARDADLLRCALAARSRSIPAALALGVFTLAGLSVWAQLSVSWQWEPPSGPGQRAGMVLMSLGAAGIALAGLIAILRALPAAFGRLRRTAWLTVALLAAVALVLGSVHFGHHWPGSGGHRWAGRDLVPGWLARPIWAATLWISAYWAHPAALGRFPLDLLTWMLTAPMLILMAGLGFQRGTGGRSDHGAGAVPAGRYAARTRPLLTLAPMACLLAGAACWVTAAGRHNPKLPGVGLIDVAALALMTSTLVLTWTSRHTQSSV